MKRVISAPILIALALRTSLAVAAVIPPEWLYCVVAIGVKAEKVDNRRPVQKEAIDWKGTGFLFGRFEEKIDAKTNRYYVYMVTNKHMLQDKKSIVIRFNREANEPAKDYDIQLINDGKPTWTGHPKESIDVAVIAINANILTKERMRFHYFRSDLDILTVDKMSETGMTEGDPVFVVGYPMGLVGEERQYAILRSGSIARIRDLLDNRSHEFVVDAFVFPGNSGGPVVAKPEIMAIQGTKSRSNATLIGIVKGYIPYQEIAISQQTKRARIMFEENSGLTAVIPVDFIIETIEAHLKKVLPRP